jgi:hypothetical protein
MNDLHYFSADCISKQRHTVSQTNATPASIINPVQLTLHGPNRGIGTQAKVKYYAGDAFYSLSSSPLAIWALFRTFVKFPKNANLWLPAYIRDRARHFTAPRRAKRLWVSITDHYEPHGKAEFPVARARVAKWQDRWPKIAEAAPKDADGRPPCFTFFYPQEEYQVDILNYLAELSRSGTTDVEVHIHHRGDTAETFKAKINEFTGRLYNDHGLLRQRNGRIAFGFIHGNWALDNSRPDCCGVTGELQVLRDLGCYADFTMPSFPSATQSRIINKIYWTTGDPTKPRGFDRGIEATVGGGVQGDILMITGPTGLLYEKRLTPWLEAGELATHALPSAYRARRWLDLAPRIGDDIFLKLFGHSAREDNAEALLGTNSKTGALSSMFQWISEAAQEQDLELHWASAYQMFKAVDALIQPTSNGVK